MTQSSNSPDSITVGKNLRYFREFAGLSLQQVAEVLDVSYQQVQKYERGQNRLPLENLFRLKNFYNIPYESFFTNLASVQDRSGHDISIYTSLAQMKDKNLRSKIERIIAVLLEG